MTRKRRYKEPDYSKYPGGRAFYIRNADIIPGAMGLLLDLDQNVKFLSPEDGLLRGIDPETGDYYEEPIE